MGDVTGSVVGSICDTVARDINSAVGAKAYAELNLLAPTLDSRISFTRASSKTYVGADGLLKTAANDTCPLEYDPVTLQPVGRSFWEARTNLFRYSENFADPTWAAVNLAVSPNAGNGPRGAATMTHVTRTSTASSGGYVVQNVSQPIGAVVTRQIIAKSGAAGGRVALRLQGNYPDRADAVFNLSTGTLVGTAATSYTGVTASITPIGGGVYLCTLTATVANSALTASHCGPTDSTRPLSSWESASAVLSDVYIDCAQLEAAATAGPYIPTTTAQATRAADGPAVNDLSTLRFNAAAGTLFVESFVPTADDPTRNTTAALTGATGERIQLAYAPSARPSVVTQAGGVVAINASAAPTTRGVIQRSAIAFSTSGQSFAVTGAIVATLGASTLPSVNKLQLGNYNVSQFGGSATVRRVRYYPRKLADAELQALTT